MLNHKQENLIVLACTPPHMAIDRNKAAHGIRTTPRHAPAQNEAPATALYKRRIDDARPNAHLAVDGVEAARGVAQHDHAVRHVDALVVPALVGGARVQADGRARLRQAHRVVQVGRGQRARKLQKALVVCGRVVAWRAPCFIIITIAPSI